MVGRQLPIFSLAIPAYLVVLYAGWRRMVEVWPAVLVAGATFAIGQFTVSNFVGPELTDALSALVSLTSVALLLRVWQPAEEFTEGARLDGGFPRGARYRRPRGPRLRDLRHPDRHGAHRPDRQLRRHVDVEAAGQRDGAAQVRPGRQQAVSGSVVRTDAPPPSRRASASRCGSSTGRARTRSATARSRRSCSAKRRSSPPRARIR